MDGKYGCLKAFLFRLRQRTPRDQQQTTGEFYLMAIGCKANFVMIDS